MTCSCHNRGISKEHCNVRLFLDRCKIGRVSPKCGSTKIIILVLPSRILMTLQPLPYVSDNSMLVLQQQHVETGGYDPEVGVF